MRVSAAGYGFQWPEPSASSGLAAELRNRPRAQCGVSLSEQGKEQHGRLSDSGPLIAAQAAAASSKISGQAGWASGWAEPGGCAEISTSSRTASRLSAYAPENAAGAVSTINHRKNSGVPPGLGGGERGLGGAPAQKKKEHPAQEEKKIDRCGCHLLIARAPKTAGSGTYWAHRPPPSPNPRNSIFPRSSALSPSHQSPRAAPLFALIPLPFRSLPAAFFLAEHRNSASAFLSPTEQQARNYKRRIAPHRNAPQIPAAPRH